MFAADDGRRGGRGQRPGPGARRAARGLGRRDRPRCSTRPALTPPAGVEPSAAPARAACTASTWATCWPRCRRCSAQLPRGRVVSLIARPPGRVLEQVLDPEVPALSLCDLGIVRDVRGCVATARRGRGADADLQRLPGHRGHRAERDRRARRRRPRPGARDDAARAGLDHRLDQRRRPAQAARLRHRAAGAGRRRRRACRSASCAARRAVACPRCGSAHTERCRPSAPPPARRCTAASPAANPSSTSSRYERDVPAVPRPARCARIEPDTAEAVIVTFDVPPRAARGLRLHAGPVPDAAQDRSTARTCGARTRSAPASTTASCAWACARSRAGVFSNWINEHLQPGDTISVMAPQGRFFVPLDAAARRHHVGIAGGSGITPILSIMKTVLAREPQSRFTLIYGNRTLQLDDVQGGTRGPEEPLPDAPGAAPCVQRRADRRAAEHRPDRTAPRSASSWPAWCPRRASTMPTSAARSR